TPVRPGSMRSSAGSTKLLKPLSLSLRISMRGRPSSTSPGGLQRRFESVPGGDVLDLAAVDEEGRRAGDAEFLGLLVGAVGNRLHLVAVGEALQRLLAGDAARGEEIDQPGGLRHLLEAPVRRQVLRLRQRG